MLTQAELKAELEYDPLTGVFRWIKPAMGRSSTTLTRGTNSFGYDRIQVNGERYLVHHLAWLYVYGELPQKLDHKNNCKTDNRISNLRKASNSQNKANMKIPSTNKSGIKGVRFRKGRWLAQIKVNQKAISLGSFSSKEEAARAYATAAKLHFGEFALTEETIQYASIPK